MGPMSVPSSNPSAGEGGGPATGHGRPPLDPTPAQLEVAARTFALLAAPVRLHLVSLAAEGEFDVGTLAERVGVSIATASQHLSKLRLAGIIAAHRDGRRQIYVVDDPHVLTLVHQIYQHIAPDGTLAPDPPLDPSLLTRPRA